MCSRIARAFLLSSSRQPFNPNNNLKNFGSGTSVRPDLESKVDYESPGQMGSCEPNMHARWLLTFYPDSKWIFWLLKLPQKVPLNFQ